MLLSAPRFEGTYYQAVGLKEKAQRKPDLRCLGEAKGGPKGVTSVNELKTYGDGGGHDALEERALALKQRALEHTRRREAEEALRCYSRALELSPAGRIAHICLTNRATLKLRNGDVAGARRDCDAAIELRPRYGKAHTRLGLVLVHLGDVRGALAAYAQALRLDPADDIAISLMADAKTLLERCWRQDDARRVEEARRAALTEDAQVCLAAEEAYVQFVEACAERTEAELAGRAGARNSINGEANGAAPRSKSLPRARHTALEVTERAKREADERRTAELRRRVGVSHLRAQRRATFGADGDPPAPNSPGGLEGWGWDRERERIRSRRGAAASLSATASLSTTDAPATGANAALQPPKRGRRAATDGSVLQLEEGEAAAATATAAPQRFRHRVVRGSSAEGTNAVAAAAAAAAAAAPEAPSPLQMHRSSGGGGGNSGGVSGNSGGTTPPALRARPPRPHRSGSRDEPAVSPSTAAALSLVRSPKDGNDASAAKAVTGVAAASARECMREVAPWARAGGSPGGVWSPKTEQEAAVGTAAASPCSTPSPSCGGPLSSLSPLGPTESFKRFATNGSEDANAYAAAHGYPAAYATNGYVGGCGGRRDSRPRAPMDTVALVGPRPRGMSEPAMRGRSRTMSSGCGVEDGEDSHDERDAGGGWHWQDSAASGAETDSLAPEAWTWQPARGGAVVSRGGTVTSVTARTASGNTWSWNGTAVIPGGIDLPGCAPSLDAAAAAYCGGGGGSRPSSFGSGGSVLSGDGDAVRAAVRTWLEAVVGRRSKVPLGTWLADGRVLVDLVNALAPGSATWQPGTTAAEREHNVSSFLRACADLGMPGNTLFRPSDLLDGDDLRSVVECLHFLARHLKLLAPRFDGPVLGATS